MSKLITDCKWRWLTSLVAVTIITVGTFFLSSASGRQPKVTSASVQPERTATHLTAAQPSADATTAAFTFSAPMELTGHPPSPAFFQADAEPEIAVDNFGTVYVTAIQGVPGGTDLWKSTNKGASFVFLGQPDGAQDHCNPPLVQCAALGGGDDQIDVSPGGYLYVSSLWLGNVTMSTSYDGATGGAVPGQAWQVNPVSAGVISDDRQWVAAYGPQTINMTYAATAATRPPGGIGLFFVKSTDSGKTFGAPVEITAATALDTVNVEGNLVVDPYNGNLYTVYIPLNQNNIIKLASSTDGGTTWTVTTAYTGPVGTSNRGVFPILAIDRGGNLHLVFTRVEASRACHIWMTSTSNPAAATPTWLPAVQVDSGGGNTATAVEPWVVAGSPGIVDIAWLGSAAANPDSPSDWRIFFSQTSNALSGSPLFNESQVTTNRIHNHSVCLNGGACASAGTAHGEPGNRDLLEYFRITLDPDGNVNIAYPDSVNNCDPSVCRTNTWFVKQIGGAGAYAPPPAPAPATFAANLVMPNSTGVAEPNMRADSHNCLYSGAPGPPDAWKSTDAGSSFFQLPNPVVSAGKAAGGGDSEIVTFPQPNGARPDQVYYADLAVASVNISKSTDGGATWFAPGPGGAGGEVSVSTDRQWMSADRNGANQTVYLWEHEFVSQILRMNALTNDMAWSPFASGMTDPELIAPPGSTIQNTVPGPTFVDPATHQVYGFLSASTVTTNVVGAPTGKLPNVWEADGAGTFTPGVPPGPFTNHPVFKGVIDSPISAPSPGPTPDPAAKTFGSNTSNLFNGAAIDSAGNIYATWATPNARNGLYDVWFASSRDHGKTFYGPFKINPSGIQGNMPWIAAGDNGRVDIVYYGSPDTEDPTTSTHDKWYVFFAQSLNAADREPAFTIAQASDHIMHQGPICNVGILCGSGTRQLLDFFQVAIGPDGMANIAYADTGAANGTPHISYARQNSGPSALVNPSGVTCLGGAPIPLKVVSQKTHGTVGTFDVVLPLSPHGIECRNGQPGANKHKVVFTFPVPITLTSASINSGNGNVNSTTVSGNTVTVNFTASPGPQKVVIKLTAVNDGAGNTGDISWPIDILLADVNSSRQVDSGDVLLLQKQNGQALPPTGSADFRRDINLNGFIDSGDVLSGQKHNPSVLPP